MGLSNAHPAVIAASAAVAAGSLGGDTAQCVAMIKALHAVLRDFAGAPGGGDFRRELSAALDREVRWFREVAGGLAAPMRNFVRWLRALIAETAAGAGWGAAGGALTARAEAFLESRVLRAREQIATGLAEKLGKGCVVLVFAFSSIVADGLLRRAERREEGLRVIVLDAPPARDGRALATSLVDRGVEVEYGMLAAAHWLLEGATLVLLGAQEIAANGVVLTRPGSAVLAIMAKERGVPVVVAAQTLKFTDEIFLDRPGDKVDAVPANDVQVIVTEIGDVVPSDAPQVFEKYNQGFCL